jgi:hypothetical protein
MVTEKGIIKTLLIRERRKAGVNLPRHGTRKHEREHMQQIWLSLQHLVQ